MLAVQRETDVQHDLPARLAQARTQTDNLFSIVKSEFLYERPIPERHRIIFYAGHLEAFDWNLLRERVLGKPAFHPELDQIFAFGIDPVGGGLPADQPSDWPSREQLHDYVARVRNAIDTGLTAERLAQDCADHDRSPCLLLHVAIEHRLMHAETLAYMLHQLPHQQKIPQASPPECAAPPVKPEMVEIPEGVAVLGSPRGHGVFGWDNEYEESLVPLSPFAIDRYKVTNGEYLQFVIAGGYENRSLWSDADWRWKAEQNVSHPVCWQGRDGQWRYRTMFEEVSLPLDWPAYVSHAEASAYARWVGKALPTEAQWHRAAYGRPQGTEGIYPWGAAAPSRGLGNFDFERWNPTPVGAFPQGQSAFGVFDLLGNGWEWTSTTFGPFPGFQPFSFYPGYSANFFDGRHLVMKGGSQRTAACLLRRSFRNWFQPHYQYVYAGFRCVENQ